MADSARDHHQGMTPRDDELQESPEKEPLSFGHLPTEVQLQVVGRVTGAADRKALRACSRALRRQVDSQVSAVAGRGVASLTAFQSLARAPWALRRLALNMSPWTYGGGWGGGGSSASILAGVQGAAWPALGSLELAFVALSPTVARALVSCHLPALRALCVDGKATLPAMEAREGEAAHVPLEVLASGRWPLLASLSLPGQQHLGAGAIAALAQLSDWPQLAELGVSECRELGVAEVVAAATAAGWQLTALALDRLPVCAAAAAALAAAPWGAGLRELSLAWCRLEPAAAEALSAAAWPALSALSVAENPGLVDAGVAHLARGRWPALESLDVRGTGVGTEGLAEGLAALAAADWPALRRLALDDNRSGGPLDAAPFLAAGWPAERVAAVVWHEARAQLYDEDYAAEFPQGEILED